MRALNRRTLGVALAIGALLAAGTTAYAAVRFSAPRPTAADLPALSTSRPIELAPVSAVSTVTPTAGPSAPKRTTPPDQGAARVQPGPSRNPRSQPTRTAPKSGVSQDDDSHETVVAPIHDSDEHEEHDSGSGSDGRSDVKIRTEHRNAND